MVNVLVIDGQGGKIGALIVEALIKKAYPINVVVVGTNAVATQTMMKVGVKQGGTGENPVVVNASKADIIISPIGLMIENAMYGEVTAKMNQALLQSQANKIIIPFSQCGSFHFVSESVSLNQLIDLTIARFEKILKDES